ncbi:MAG: hypothetical protein E7J62_05720 [Serratia marcescens]|nr:hypothetical protein [Serratia marcescens]
MKLLEDIKIELLKIEAEVLSSEIDKLIDKLICKVEKIEEIQKNNSSINPKISEIMSEKLKEIRRNSN